MNKNNKRAAKERSGTNNYNMLLVNRLVQLDKAKQEDDLMPLCDRDRNGVPYLTFPFRRPS